jgi:hypothetical protein
MDRVETLRFRCLDGQLQANGQLARQIPYLSSYIEDNPEVLSDSVLEVNMRSYFTSTVAIIVLWLEHDIVNFGVDTTIDISLQKKLVINLAYYFLVFDEFIKDATTGDCQIQMIDFVVAYRDSDEELYRVELLKKNTNVLGRLVENLCSSCRGYHPSNLGNDGLYCSKCFDFLETPESIVEFMESKGWTRFTVEGKVNTFYKV